MRKAIYQHLTTNCRSIPVWKQPYQADAQTPKPYGVIVLGEHILSPVNRWGSFRSLYIWPYVGGSSYLVLDEAIAEIRGLLSGVTLETDSGNKFEIEWVNEGRDFYDNDLRALTRRLEFRVPLVVPG